MKDYAVRFCEFLQVKTLSCNADSATLLRSRGKRVTNARLAVLAALRHAESHLTATQVIEEMQGTGAHVDQSTVYRALADLRDAKLIAESRFGSGEAAYEWIAESNHHHLYCTRCEQVLDLDSEVVEGFMSQVSARYGFKTDARHLVLTGTCGDCQKGGG